MKVSLILFAVFIFCPFSWSQLPQSAIYLLSLKKANDSSWVVHKISYLSAFNPDGYNNQVFLHNDSILLATIGIPETKQTDIYRFDLINKTKENLSQSLSSEYSPRIDPHYVDFVSCIQVPLWDTSQQNLLQIPLNPNAKHSYRFNNFAKIGYYRPLADGRDVCFIVGPPHVLSLCQQKSNTKKIFASDIGRCFEVINDEIIYFVHKLSPTKWLLKAYNIKQNVLLLLLKCLRVPKILR